MRLLRSTSSSSSSPERAAGSDRRRTHVYLNVYDITPMNNYLYWLGLGIFHSGIEVDGMEYGFGAHGYPTSGVFEVEPKTCPGFIFRRSVSLGAIEMSRLEFRSFVESLASNYHGDTYHLIEKNCNHFSDDLSKRLTGRCIPGWVNRLAKLGSLCSCFLPEGLKVRAAGRLPTYPALSDDEEDGLPSNVSIIDDSDLEELDHQLLWMQKSSAATAAATMSADIQLKA